MNKFTKETFLQQASTVHGNKFDYSHVVYINNSTKVTIICPNGHTFDQTPSNHLMGKGCRYCAGNVQSTTERFIERAKVIHGNLFDYSKTEYISYKVEVEILCPIHGSFDQTPDNHLKGKGCKYCADNVRLTKEQFIDRAKKIHSDKYDYSLVEYKNAHTKITIICPKHGNFDQLPNSHLRNNGCPDCGLFSGAAISKKETEWLDSLNNSNIVRQYRLVSRNKKIIVDGFDPSTNTIYEYHGKYWHGHPDIFPDRKMIHPASKISVDELYKKTIERESLLKDAGYNIISIWE
jgi:hypothetical protein